MASGLGGETADAVGHEVRWVNLEHLVGPDRPSMELQGSRRRWVPLMSRDLSAKVLALVRNELLRLARFEDALAAAEAEAVPYWAACPDSVRVHRMAAVALRARAEATVAGPGCRA